MKYIKFLLFMFVSMSCVTDMTLMAATPDNYVSAAMSEISKLHETRKTEYNGNASSEIISDRTRNINTRFKHSPSKRRATYKEKEIYVKSLTGNVITNLGRLLSGYVAGQTAELLFSKPRVVEVEHETHYEIINRIQILTCQLYGLFMDRNQTTIDDNFTYIEQNSGIDRSNLKNWFLQVVAEHSGGIDKIENSEFHSHCDFVKYVADKNIQIFNAAHDAISKNFKRVPKKKLFNLLTELIASSQPVALKGLIEVQPNQGNSGSKLLAVEELGHASQESAIDDHELWFEGENVVIEAEKFFSIAALTKQIEIESAYLQRIVNNKTDNIHKFTKKAIDRGLNVSYANHQERFKRLRTLLAAKIKESRDEDVGSVEPAKRMLQPEKPRIRFASGTRDIQSSKLPQPTIPGAAPQRLAPQPTVSIRKLSATESWQCRLCKIGNDNESSICKTCSTQR